MAIIISASVKDYSRNTQPRMYYINRTSRDAHCVSTITILEGEDWVILFLVVRLIRFYIFHLTNLAPPSSISYLYIHWYIRKINTCG